MIHVILRIAAPLLDGVTCQHHSPDEKIKVSLCWQWVAITCNTWRYALTDRYCFHIHLALKRIYGIDQKYLKLGICGRYYEPIFYPGALGFLDWAPISTSSAVPAVFHYIRVTFRGRAAGLRRMFCNSGERPAVVLLRLWSTARHIQLCSRSLLRSSPAFQSTVMLLLFSRWPVPSRPVPAAGDLFAQPYWFPRITFGRDEKGREGSLREKKRWSSWIGILGWSKYPVTIDFRTWFSSRRVCIGRWMMVNMTMPKNSRPACTPFIADSAIALLIPLLLLLLLARRWRCGRRTAVVCQSRE